MAREIDVIARIEELVRYGVPEYRAIEIAADLIRCGAASAPYRKETPTAVADLELERRRRV